MAPGSVFANNGPTLTTGRGRSCVTAPIPYVPSPWWGHAECGKTSLVEALLHAGGALHTPGSVERSTTVCDFDPLERKYRHSLSSAVAHLHYGDARIFLLDTPGYLDFFGLLSRWPPSG